MAGSKRDRQRASRQERMRAAAEARRREARRRAMLLGGIAAVLVVAIVVVVVVTRSGTKKKVAVNGSTTTTNGTAATSTSAPASAASAAGKPCVALSDPLPAGAPAVPVKVGPPPTQLVSQDLKVGTGAVVTANETLTVNYIGVACSTGKIFDSSYSRGQTASFPLSGVIKGWQDGLPGMKIGGQRLLGIPPAQAYGSTGHPPSIAPDEALWFVVEVVDAKAA